MRPSNVIEYEEEHSIHDTVEISAYFQVHKRREISERSLRTSSFFFFLPVLVSRIQWQKFSDKKPAIRQKEVCVGTKNVLEIFLF